MQKYLHNLKKKKLPRRKIPFEITNLTLIPCDKITTVWTNYLLL